TRRKSPNRDSQARQLRVWANEQGYRCRSERRRSCSFGGARYGRNSPQKHVWRARIILLTVAGPGTVEIMRRTGKSKTCVWRWQERFMHEGIEGLRRDKTRPSRIRLAANCRSVDSLN